MEYINKLQFNNGIRLNGQTPIDDRLSCSSIGELYISTSNAEACPLYNKAYTGMIVNVKNDANGTATFETYVCKNPDAYKPGEVQNVNAGNFASFWKRVDQTTYDYVHTEVDNYIKSDHIKVNSQWITCTSSNEASGIGGMSYVFNASVDGDTLKVNNQHVLSGWKFKLSKETLSDESSNYAVYDLMYWEPTATSWKTDPVKIEIPKVQVLKSVKLCKAVPDSTQLGGYRVTIYRDECTEQEWEQASGNVFLRIEWDDDNTSTTPAITYLNVEQIITIDVEPLRQRLNSLESSTYALEVSTNALEVRAHRHDTSINTLENRANVHDTSIHILDSSIVDLSTRIDNNYQTLSSSIGQTYTALNTVITDEVGTAINVINSSIAVVQQIATDASYWNRGDVLATDVIYEDYGDLKGETAGDLEGLTVSEILNRILFEFCTPNKIADMSGSISVTATNVEVGASFPAAAAFGKTFNSEKWQWKSKNYSSNGVKGPERELSQFSSVTYYYKPSSGSEIEVGTTAYNALKVAEGTNSNFYGVIEYSAKNNATDSRNNDRDKNGNYYAQAKSGSLTTGNQSFVGGWKTYTNAPKTYTSAATAWSSRATEPGAILANDCYNKIHSGASGKASETSSIMKDASHTVWFQWPSEIDTATQFLLVWVPKSYHITAAKFANDAASNTFDINASFTYQATKTFQNAPGGEGQFDEYKIEKAGGISTVQITITKGARS